MPKIEVNEKLFFNLLGTHYDYATLENRLESGKAELDESLILPYRKTSGL